MELLILMVMHLGPLDMDMNLDQVMALAYCLEIVALHFYGVKNS